MKKIKMLVIQIFLYASVSCSFADSLYNNLDSTQAFSLIDNDSSVVNNSYSVNKVFSSFNQVIATLNKLGTSTRIVNKEENEPTNINITSKRTIRDFINIASAKFGYTWAFINNTVIFTPLNPVTKKNNSTLITAVPTTAPTSSSMWILQPTDKSLRSVLTKWTKLAGWQLIWNTKADYPIEAAWSISGNFESAVNEVLMATQHTEIPLMAMMYDSNRVLEIYSPAASRQ